MMSGRSLLRFVLLLLLSAGSAQPLRAEQKIAGDEPPHAGFALIPLIEDLSAENPEARIAAAMTIRELGATAELAVPLLVKALEDPLVPMRRSAAGALGGIGPGAAAAVPALTASLSDPHRFVRSWAAMALVEIGPASRPATDALIELMRTDVENLRGRSWAASALPVIGADAERAVPALVQTLATDESEEVRAVAVLSLEKYATDAARLGATEGLIQALSDPHSMVRRNAACALPKMGGDASLGASALALALRDESPRVRVCAARALGKIGGRAIEQMHELEALFSDEDEEVRRSAEQAYRRLEALEAKTDPAS
jgi:HEAT repeat protein